MTNRSDRAVELHKQGYNCAQAVICAYCDLFGIDDKTAFMMSEGFGGGMGGMQETCGAVTGMFMLAGLKNSSGTNQTLTKADTYKLVRELAQSFKDKNSSIVCKELKGLTGGPMLRSCDGCIEDACVVFEDYLNSQSNVIARKTEV